MDIAPVKLTYKMEFLTGYVRMESELRAEPGGWTRQYTRALTYDDRGGLVETGPWEPGFAYRFE